MDDNVRELVAIVRERLAAVQSLAERMGLRPFGACLDCQWLEAPCPWHAEERRLRAALAPFDWQQRPEPAEWR